MKTINPSPPFRIDGGRRRSIKFFTLGCKVNQYETQAMRESLIRCGFKELGNNKPANFYVINTCTVTNRADSESLNLIRRAKRENSEARVIVTGCLAELDSDRIKKTDSQCVIIKNSDKDNISNHPIFINGQNRLNGHNGPNGHNGISYFKGHTRAFLKIQDGCDNSCSYCKVPLVRGASRSRPLEDIVKEAKELVKNNYKEIVLTGICLGAYGRDLGASLRGTARQSRSRTEAISKKGLLRPFGARNDGCRIVSLVEVIDALENIDGLLRIRLSSIEASDITHRLIYKMKESKKLCRHLHIPIQSGDDEILRKMNRRYCRDDYIRLISRLKENIPGVSVTTDCLVGFPGETEKQFNNTLKLVDIIEPLKVHAFPYSKRKGTPSADNFKNEISPVVIKKRMQVLQKVALNSARLFKRRFLNKYMEVLFEEKEQGFWTGYTDNYIKVAVKSDECLKNKLISLKIFHHHLIGG